MENQKPVLQQGNMISFLALLRKYVSEAFDRSLGKAILKIRIANEKVYFTYLGLIGKQIGRVELYLKTLPQIDILLAKMTQELSTTIGKLGKEGEFKVTVKDKETIDSGLTTIGEKLDVLAKIMDDMTKIGTKGSSASESITQKMEEVKKAILAIKLEIPKIQTVKVANPVEFPLKELTTALENIRKSVQALKLSVSIPEQKQIQIPAFPTSFSLKESKLILDSLTELKDELTLLPGKIPQIEFPKIVRSEITAMPPMKYPLPVTNININPLNGTPKSTSITVGTSVVALPPTALSFRRSLIIYNNDSATTVFIGGSDVTTANGLPVPPRTYSPPLDCGPKMNLYGVAATNINIRVLEVSNDNRGG